MVGNVFRFQVNSDGDPYPPPIQRLVPGRERCSDSFLIPYIVRPRGAANQAEGGAAAQAPSGVEIGACFMRWTISWPNGSP